MNIRLSLIILLCTQISACHVMRWHEVAPFVSQRTDFATDENVVVMQNYQVNHAAHQNPGAILGASRQHQHQLFLERHGTLEALTRKRPGADEPGSLYYVNLPDKNLAYILIAVRIQGQNIRYEKINRHDGHVTILRHNKGGVQTELCPPTAPPAFVVEQLRPAAAGTLLAHVFSPACGVARIEFLEPTNAQVVDVQEIALHSVHESATSAEGVIIYPLMSTTPAWHLKPGTAAVIHHLQ
jgi:hypothetical protein